MDIWGGCTGQFSACVGHAKKARQFFCGKGVDVKEFARGDAGEAVERLGTYSGSDKTSPPEQFVGQNF